MSKQNRSVSSPSAKDDPAAHLLPSSRDAEMALLSSIMNLPDSFSRVLSRVTASDFFFRENQIIFNAIASRLDANESIDTISLAEHLRREGDIEKAGDIKYLSQLRMFGASTEPGAIDTYVGAVKERSHKRKLRTLALEVASSALKEDVDADSLIDRLSNEINTLNESNGLLETANEPVMTSLVRVIDKIDSLFNGEGEQFGVSTGFTELDDLTQGLQPADMIIIAGRPSMGKTTLAMNIAENAAIKGKKVQVFSLEMPTDKLTMRMISSLGRIDSSKLKRGALDDEDWMRLTNAVSVINSMEMYIDDTPGLSINEFKARARKAHKEHNLDLIVIDYLQLMRASGKLISNRTDEVAEISKGIKQIAKELNVPVIALSQLNRGLEQRPNKRPIMSDLRESGSIEQDADIIAFVYRDEVYNEDSPDKGKAEIIIGKFRDGEIGMIPLLFEGRYTRFYNFGITAENVSHESEYGTEGYVIPDLDNKKEQPVEDDEPPAFIDMQESYTDGLAEIPMPPQQASDYL